MNRRDLLAGLPALTSSLAQDRKIRIGVAGGGFGTSFQFHEHPNAVVQAVTDLRPERRARLQKTYGCDKAYQSLEEMLKDRQVEAVGLFTPAPDHVRHAKLCLAAGKHILSAVPAAMTLEECNELVEAVEHSGLKYMMAETSYYQQLTISARQFFEKGEFGRLFAGESEYHHPGLEELYFEGAKRTWRHGFPPMHYPTHCTAHWIGVTGERLTHVTCVGWGDGHPILKDNQYKNPFWNETAFFQSEKGSAFRVAVWWRGAQRGTERAQWLGEKMSFYMQHPALGGPAVVRATTRKDRDDAGFERWASAAEKFEEVKWWATDLLPVPLRHNSGHEGSHTFITHEFITAILQNRRPTVDVYSAVSYTAPGIVAHQSALRDGERLKIPVWSAR